MTQSTANGEPNEARLRALAEYDQRRLEQFRRSFKTGNIGALLSALEYCQKHRLMTPMWVLEGAYIGIVAATTDAWPKKSGRISNPLSALRRDLIDYWRWDTVNDVLEKQKEAAADLKALQKISKAKRNHIEAVEARAAKLGDNLEDALLTASDILAKTLAFGGPDAIRKSYYTVNTNLSDPEQAARYHMISPSVARALGLQDNFGLPSS